MKHDNKSGSAKAMLRHEVRKALTEPISMIETHGGKGWLWKQCWSDVLSGVVFDVDAGKCAKLAVQRPGWAVFLGHAEPSLADGVWGHVPVNLVDIDPYGDPWPTVDAVLMSDRPTVPELTLIITDGLRQKVQRGGAWNVASLAPAIQQFGSNFWSYYMDVCRWMMAQKAAQAGYALSGFRGLHCGWQDQVTLYAVTLSR